MVKPDSLVEQINNYNLIFNLYKIFRLFTRLGRAPFHHILIYFANGLPKLFSAKCNIHVKRKKIQLFTTFAGGVVTQPLKGLNLNFGQLQFFFVCFLSSLHQILLFENLKFIELILSVCSIR